jgi:hypothetical protein
LDGQPGNPSKLARIVGQMDNAQAKSIRDHERPDRLASYVSGWGQVAHRMAGDPSREQVPEGRGSIVADIDRPPDPGPEEPVCGPHGEEEGQGSPLEPAELGPDDVRPDPPQHYGKDEQAEDCGHPDKDASPGSGHRAPIRLWAGQDPAPTG